MNVILTDPDVNAFETNCVDWNSIIKLLRTCNTVYTYATGININGDLIFTARRKLSDNIWIMRVSA